MRSARAAALLAALLVTAPLGRPAFAQSEAEVAAARRTFGEAVKDEEKRNFDVALAKFRQVKTVRDTPAVRFRIGACLEALGRLGEARAAYAGAAELAEADTAQGEVAEASREKVAALDKRLPTLTLSLPPNAPSDAVVTLDEQPATLGQPIVVEPGEHRIHAHAAGVPPYESRVTLHEGARTALIVPFEAKPKPVEVPPPPGPSRATVGWVLVGSGAGLVVISGVTMLLRASAISSIEDDCPQNRCPESKRDDVVSARDRAQTLLPISITTGALGVVAAGVGVTLLMTPPRKQEVTTARDLRLRFASTARSTGLLLEGRF